MSQPSSPSSGRGTLSSLALLRQLEELTTRLAGASQGAGAAAAQEALGACPDALKQVCSALHGMADAIEAGRTDAVGRCRQELRALRTGLNQNMRELGEANARIGSDVGDQLEELDAISEFEPSAGLVARVRGVTLAMQQATAELGGYLASVAEQVEDGTKRIAALEARVSPPRRTEALDPDTRLHTRAGFDGRLQFAVATGPFRGPWSVVVAEIDRLVEIGEQFGRIVADALVFKVARILEELFELECRDAFVAKYNGGAFAVVVPGTVPWARGLAEQLREGVASARWQYRGTDEQSVLDTTISVGVAAYQRGDSVASLTERVEQALEEAKQQGSNRVVVAQG